MQSRDYLLRFATLLAQAVADIRALTGWLLAQGSPAVALWGISMGGWHAGLVAGCDARLAAVVLNIPGVCMQLIPEQAEHIWWRSFREAILAQCATYLAMDQTPINLVNLRPVIPRENLLIIEGKYDLMVSRVHVEQLWEAWDRPEIWRLPYGHLTCGALPVLPGRILHWLAPRLDVAYGQLPRLVTTMRWPDPRSWCHQWSPECS